MVLTWTHTASESAESNFKAIELFMVLIIKDNSTEFAEHYHLLNIVDLK